MQSGRCYFVVVHVSYNIISDYYCRVENINSVDLSDVLRKVFFDFINTKILV